MKLSSLLSLIFIFTGTVFALGDPYYIPNPNVAPELAPSPDAIKGTEKALNKMHKSTDGKATKDQQQQQEDFRDKSRERNRYDIPKRRDR